MRSKLPNSSDFGAWLISVALCGEGEVPGPDRKVGRDPVWSRAKLQAWLDGDEHTLSIAKQRDEALRRAAGG